jgi:anti-sigma B factor antagonist
MKLGEEQHSDHTILRLSGSLKVGETARAFAERIERIATDRAGALILELSELEYVDSTGVGLLVAAYRRFQPIGREVILVNPQRRVLSGLRVTHLDSLFPIHETLDLALAALARKEGEETGEQRSRDDL